MGGRFRKVSSLLRLGCDIRFQHGMWGLHCLPPRMLRLFPSGQLQPLPSLLPPQVPLLFLPVLMSPQL